MPEASGCGRELRELSKGYGYGAGVRDFARNEGGRRGTTRTPALHSRGIRGGTPDCAKRHALANVASLASILVRLPRDDPRGVPVQCGLSGVRAKRAKPPGWSPPRGVCNPVNRVESASTLRIGGEHCFMKPRKISVL